MSWPFSRISPARRLALFLVALFELTEVALLWTRGVQNHSWTPLALGFFVLLVLLSFELAEHTAEKRDHQLSREISEWLLPHTPPSLPGVDVAFSSRIANHVGSDYFNVFPRVTGDEPEGSHRVFIVMADIAGIGLQGALLMATFQASLRVLADSSMPLLELASQMNEWCWDRSLEGRHFTMTFLADLDPETGALSYVCAGHQPPLVSRIGGEIERLDVAGLPLGVGPNSDYEMGSTDLGVGDTLVVFSDGVVEAENQRREKSGEDRLIRVLRSRHGITANETLNQLTTSMLSFCGSMQQRDDLSFVILRRRQPRGSFHDGPEAPMNV